MARRGWPILSKRAAGIGPRRSAANQCAQRLRRKLAEAVDWIISNVWADDFVGSNTYTYSPAYLASRLPGVGGSFTDTRTYSDGDGNYTMTTQVTRVG